jgi:1-deoxy-D-xylulose 5-phosphate reductoisomerase
MVKHVIILGSTGSIGTQALQVIADNPDKFHVVGIAAAGRNPQLIIDQAQALRLNPDHIAVANPQAAEPSPPRPVKAIPCDTVLNALVGSLGLAATMATIEVGATLALANKESLVAGGTLVTESAAPGQIIPVDSEHSAMAQCLRAGSRTEVDRIVLTASGGPFRGWTRQPMWDGAPEPGAAPPPPRAPPPSMKLPFALALHWPYRVPGAQPALDFSAATATNWEFMPVDNEAFPAVQLARQVATYGGMLPAVYNAANEQAAAQFLAGRIAFPQIVDTVSEILSHAEAFARTPESIMEVLECEKEARSLADRYLATIMR